MQQMMRYSTVVNSSHSCYLFTAFCPNITESIGRRLSLSSSSITMTASLCGSRISRELLDLESPNFTRASIPTYSTSTPDMTSLTTSGRKLSQTNCQKCGLRQLQVEVLVNGLSEDHEILNAYQGQAAPQTGHI